MSEVTYSQGMTNVWSDGEKITVNNKSGIKWVKDNVEQIFGMGEWDKIQKVAYSEYNEVPSKNARVKTYECVSGYIPQRVLEDLKNLPEEELSDEEKRKAALEALNDL